VAADKEGIRMEAIRQMIFIDSRVGSAELLPPIKRLGVHAELTQLEFGDVCFEGKGPKGIISIGIERKTIHDMLNCIDDARYVAHQRPGMMNMYDKSLLVIEGVWAAGSGPNWEGLLITNKGAGWFPLVYRSQRVMYSKLYRYLLSVSLSGVIITYSMTLEHTAVNICNCYHYFQKKWENHTSLLETQKLAIPDMRGKPSLVRRWAAQLTGVGVKHSIDAERLFKKASSLAQADELDWLRVPGIGVKTAQNIVKEINSK